MDMPAYKTARVLAEHLLACSAEELQVTLQRAATCYTMTESMQIEGPCLFMKIVSGTAGASRRLAAGGDATRASHRCNMQFVMIP